MTLNKINLGCKIIALLMLLTVIFNWNIFRLFFVYSLPIGWYFIITVMILVFFVLNTVSAVGLYWSKRWGFTMSYLAIVFSTLFFSTCYIPYATHLFPAKDKHYVMIIINLSVILCIGVFQYLSRRKSSTLMQG